MSLLPVLYAVVSPYHQIVEVDYGQGTADAHAHLLPKESSSSSRMPLR